MSGACNTRAATAPSVESVLLQLSAAGVVLPPGRVRVDSYGDSEALSEELLDLIRSGRKRAGTSLLRAMQAEGATLPRAGDIEVVLSFSGEPVLVTRIVRSEVLPFSSVTAEYAAIEGEGDGSLEYWRRAHWSFFGRECARLGIELSESMPVVCTVIEVVSEVPPRAFG